MRKHVLAVALAASTLFASCGAPRPHAGTSDVARRTSAASSSVSSNILREDYAGSAACSSCHSAIAEEWAKTPMHSMTRDAKSALVRAPFTGTALRFKTDSVDLSQSGTDRWVTVHSKEQGDHQYRVTRVIGGHYREDYAGVELSGGDEQILPISYLIFNSTFRYKGYSVMSRERPGLRAGPVWSRTCIFCHNTQPYFSTLLGTLPEGKGLVYQGITVDPLLPQAKRWSTTVGDRAGLDRALGAEIQHFGGTPREALVAQAIAATRGGFSGADLVEVGIGCEACHLGSSAHVRDPKTHTSLVPTSPFLAIQGDVTRAQSINHACSRCHQVLFTHYPYTWEGGDRARSPGGSHINSGEARDFMLGACSTRADCTRCHDPHAPDNQAKAKELEGRAGDQVCTACHDKYKTDEALKAHAHHDPAREGARCMSCHMPRKNMSLDLRLTRYHRIGSPTDADKQKDRPLECALCHADKKVSEILDTMESWYPARFDRTLPTLLYGSLDANVMRATLALGKPHEQAVALYVLGESKSKTDASAMAHELVNEYPLVRFYANAALVKTKGSPSPVDLNGTDEEITKQAAAWLGGP